MEVRVFNIRMNNKYLIKDQNRVNDFLKTVQLKKSSTQFVEGKENMWSLLVYYEYGKQENNAHEIKDQEPVLNKNEAKLAGSIRQWRQLKAENERLAPYLVLTNKSIALLAKSKAKTDKELLQVYGIGQAKVDLYGQELLKLLNAK
ncbi:MAG: HRDC domain-containing protein [Flavobacteriaceae bacterium]|nr:HRDC domain-containing protein [Flavobacteriaceae bacterium]